jgi:hypothetical protein
VSLDDTVMITKNPDAGTPSGNVTFTLYGPFTSQNSVSCSGPPIAGSTTVMASAEGYDSNGNGFWTANIDVPATNGSTGSNIWYAWGASFTPTNSNYASGSLGCTSEEVNVQYGSGSGFSLPSTTPSTTP